VEVSTERLARIAQEGRIVSHIREAEAKRSKTQLAIHATRRNGPLLTNRPG